jgi:hypothetical protein
VAGVFLCVIAGSEDQGAGVSVARRRLKRVSAARTVSRAVIAARLRSVCASNGIGSPQWTATSIGAALQHPHEMRSELHVAVPAQLRAVAAGERQAVQPRIGDRERLQGDALERMVHQRHLRGADERGAEREHPVAVARRALGEEHDQLSARKPPRHHRGDFSGRPLVLALDEDGALHPRQKADAGPAGHLGFRHEGQRSQAPERPECRSMSSGWRERGRGRRAGRLAGAVQADVQRPEGEPVEQDREAAGDRPVEAQPQPLQREHRHEDERQDAEARARNDRHIAQPRLSPPRSQGERHGQRGRARTVALLVIARAPSGLDEAEAAVEGAWQARCPRPPRDARSPTRAAAAPRDAFRGAPGSSRAGADPARSAMVRISASSITMRDRQKPCTTPSRPMKSPSPMIARSASMRSKSMALHGRAKECAWISARRAAWSVSSGANRWFGG